MLTGATLSKDGKSLTITLSVNEVLDPSGSGKTLQVATTGGNTPTPITMEDEKGRKQAVVVGATAYIKNADYVKQPK